MATLTMRIDGRLVSPLVSPAAAAHRKNGDLPREMLLRQISIRRFQAITYTETGGFLVDENIFRDVS